MKIIVSGRDRTADLGPGIAADAARHMQDPRCAPLPWSLNARSLGDAKSESAYHERFMQLIRSGSHVDTLDHRIPRRRGFAGAVQGKLRSFLWKLLRYQHNRMAFRQNLINSHIVSALEFERNESAKLAARVAELERRMGDR
ncbi:MAG: hypothetical protein V1929_10010 [bacterium]